MSAVRHNRSVLLLILLAGFALRAFRLGSGSLWYDETVSVFLAGSPVPELLRHTAGDIHPPGYYLLLRVWLLLTGYPTGHAGAIGQGLEFTSAFLSLFFGVLLIALVFRLARSLGGLRIALVAAALIALSPYNIWYSQEVRMYTLGATFGVIAVAALRRAIADPPSRSPGLGQERGPGGEARTGATYPSRALHPFSSPLTWWVIYAISAACGLYTLYYFAFLLVPINIWAAARMLNAKRSVVNEDPSAIHHSTFNIQHFTAWCLANLAVLVLYAPWLPVAWRQATQPPVPPWRAATGPFPALRESWTALTAGQSLPAILWPAVLLLIPVYLLGLYALARQDHAALAPALHSSGSTRHPGGNQLAFSSSGPREEEPLLTFDLLRLTSDSSLLLLATFGSLAIVLITSLATPLYHVRYVFTYSPFFYIVLSAGLVWLATRWRFLATIAGAAWVVLALVALAALWSDPQYTADDHRAAVAYLQAGWRPGDAVLVNAGYAYPALLTYWQPDPRAPGSPSAWLSRLSNPLPGPRDAGDQRFFLTGHVDGAANLGWGDTRSDFFAMPANAALGRVQELYASYPRVWQYRIYDTVTDPGGTLRAGLDAAGRLLASQRFPGEASLRIQGFVPKNGVPDQPAWPKAMLDGIELRSEPLPPTVKSGSELQGALLWRLSNPISRTLATSLRLVGPDGVAWTQPPDERPFGPLYTSEKWQPATWQQQSLALPIPRGTPPGPYVVQLVVYDAATDKPLGLDPGPQDLSKVGDALSLGTVTVERGSLEPAQPALATFGPLDLLEASTSATTVSPGDPVPVDLTWQAGTAPDEPYVVVLQLLDGAGKMAASLEEQPLDGRYPTQGWIAGEIVGDRHTLQLPAELQPGRYRLIAGLYRAADGLRVRTRAGVFGTRPYYEIKTLTVKPGK